MNDIYSKTDNYTLIHDDMLNMGEYIKDGTIDAVITDPPYGLTSITKRFGDENSKPAQFGKDGSFARLSKGFMGKEWDGSGIEYNVDAWRKCFNALKDGGYLLAFGGTRTFHRIACAIEDAGFEIRDCIMYLYGSGFPKSLNIGLAVDKYNGVESKVVGKEKEAGKTGKNKVGNDTFIAKNQYDDGYHDIKKAQNAWAGWGTALKPAYEPIIVARKPMRTSVAENILKNGVGGINIDECRVGDEEIMTSAKGSFKEWQKQVKGFKKNEIGVNTIHNGRFPANVIHDGSEEVLGGFPSEDETESPSRFFYTAKASKKDRDEGLEAFDTLTVNDGREKSIDNAFQIGETPRRNVHPTVKPIELMQYLIKMVSPKGATILDPFMGSGSTGKAAMFENRERNANYKFIGIELTEEYLPICKARIEYAINKYEYDEKLEQEKTGQASLFDFDFGEEGK